MEWNDDTITRLRAFWAEGLSTAEIGRRLGVSKNAVVGKAHRLSLTARPSPIRRDGQKAPPRRQVKRAPGTTLPALQAALGPLPAAESARVVTERPLPPVLRAVPASRPGQRVTPCCWPIGEPGTRSFHFCDVDAVPGKPYCETHSTLAYVRIKDRREDAA